MSVRIQYEVTKRRVAPETIDVVVNTTEELRLRFNKNWTLVKGLLVTLDHEHLEQVKQNMEGVRMNDGFVVTWSGEDAVFILNNLR